jgi:hypothetical protein
MQPADLIIVDGVNEALSLAHTNIHNESRVTAWMREVPRQLAHRTGAAVILIDHVNKNKRNRGRGANGAQAKLAGLDGAAYTIDVVQPLGQGMLGVLTLRIAKDRPGAIRPHCGPMDAETRLQSAATIAVDSTGEGIVVTVGPPVPEPDERGAYRPAALMEKMSQALESELERLTWSAWAKDAQRVAGNKEAKAAAGKLLIAEGYVSAEPAPHGGTGHASVRPFRAADDPGPPDAAADVMVGEPAP